MEKILVGLDARLCGQEAIWRGMALAKRIQAELFVLVVLPADVSGENQHDHLPELARNRLEIIRQWAQEENVSTGCFVTKGKFEDEIIRFVSQNKISLFVTELDCVENKSGERDQILESIRHRLSCRLELVAPKKTD